MKETVEHRAVKIAAEMFVAAGYCKYADATQCKKVWAPGDDDCIRCIKRFLMNKARKELGGKR